MNEVAPAVRFSLLNLSISAASFLPSVEPARFAASANASTEAAPVIRPEVAAADPVAFLKSARMLRTFAFVSSP